MSIQDSDPERRNLVVTSLAFIVFYYGGGTLLEEEIRIGIVNVALNRPHVIAYFAWAMLIWFLYRYWLTHKSRFLKGIKFEFLESATGKLGVDYASSKLKRDFARPGDTKGLVVTEYSYNAGITKLCYRFAANIQWDTVSPYEKSYGCNNEDEKGEINLNDFFGYVFLIKCLAICCVSKGSFSNYLVPYVVFVIAIIGFVLRAMLIL